MMTQEEYVTFEQAKALKELGFPQKLHMFPCQYNEVTGQIVYCQDCLMNCHVVMPTLSLVQKWLREEKELFIAIEINRLSNIQYHKELPYCTMNLYEFYPDAGQMMVLNGSGGEFETYERALSAVIDKCIELLKNK